MTHIGRNTPCVRCGEQTGHRSRKVCRACLREAAGLRKTICIDDRHPGERLIEFSDAAGSAHLCRPCAQRRRACSIQRKVEAIESGGDMPGPSDAEIETLRIKLRLMLGKPVW